MNPFCLEATRSMSEIYNDFGGKSELPIFGLFQAEDSDITFISSDHVLFKVHRRNLETHARGFAPPGFETLGEAVPLTEDSSTLGLLFTFMYPRRQSDHRSTSFQVLYHLAEAAEKYEVFSAMAICRINMRKFIPIHAESIMTYGVKHGYPELVEETASLMLGKSPREVLIRLPENLVIPWILYYERWSDVLRKAVSYHETWLKDGLFPDSRSHEMRSSVPHKSNTCPGCKQDANITIIRILSKLMNPKSLLEIDLLFPATSACVGASHVGILAWKTWLKKEVSDIPKFGTFL